jgi:hypothetical protein
MTPESRMRENRLSGSMRRGASIDHPLLYSDPWVDIMRGIQQPNGSYEYGLSG